MIDWIRQQIIVYNQNSDLNKISEAFGIAMDFYEPLGESAQKHKPFYDFLFSMRPDDDTVIAAILHDIYYRGIIEQDEVRAKFGPSVLKILDSIRRVMKVHDAGYDAKSQTELLHKLFLAMSKDVRVILILLLKRFYDLYRVDHHIYLNSEEDFDMESVQRQAKENIEIYAPIAAKLGIYKLRTQIEDLSFKYLFPTEYKELNEQLRKFKKKKQIDVSRLKAKVEDFLASIKVEAKVYGRLKSIYSIHKKLKRKNYDQLANLSDVVAVRIILNSSDTDKLYSVLGHLHARWRPETKRFKDYVSVPKPNGYQSLHTVVFGLVEADLDQQVEVQVRTAQMHLSAEYGVAAHWLYKTNDQKKATYYSNSKMQWIDRLSRFYSEFLNESAMLTKVDVNIFEDRIFVLTPNGEVKDLPKGSTPIDFAYLIHTDVGNHCYMAKADGKAVPLDYELSTGQVIEIMTSPDSRPKLEWFSKARTQLAQRKIKSWFGQTENDSSTKDGKRLLNKVLAEMGKPLLDQNLSVLKSYSPNGLSFSERENLVKEVGNGTKNARDIVRRVYPVMGQKKIPTEDLELNLRKAELEEEIDDLKKKIIVGGESGLPLKLPACCCPRHGDMILGYVTRGNSITIHRGDCYMIDNLDVRRIVFANWKDEKVHAGLSAVLVLEIKPRQGLMKEITDRVADLSMKISDFTVHENKQGLTDDYFLVQVGFSELPQLNKLIDELSDLTGVLRVKQKAN